MHRRQFCAIVAVTAITGQTAWKPKRFVFRIRTKSGGIIGNIVFQAKDIFAAITKLKKRYPGCEILNAREGSSVYHVYGEQRHGPPTTRSAAD